MAWYNKTIPCGVNVQPAVMYACSAERQERCQRSRVAAAAPRLAAGESRCKAGGMDRLADRAAGAHLAARQAVAHHLGGGAAVAPAQQHVAVQGTGGWQ